MRAKHYGYAYIELLARKYPRNKEHGQNIYFNSFFMETLIDLSKRSSTPVESAIYNYSAVKR
jgi:hypothetical protein